MLLLKYCSLEPSGPSNLAALRFSSPVRIQAITIFPNDYSPFAQNTDIVSRTEPDAFFLELYFNAHPVPQPNAKEKPRPTNALVPTVIAYAGGCLEFSVNMSPEFPTRLMIVKGAFECVSMAIYGDVVSEMPPPSTTYEPKPIPSFDPIPLSNALDPSNLRDPTKLALQLLDLVPDAPPLPHVIRLMFCLKPSNDDWDLPEFPYLYADLNEEFDNDLEKAMRITSRPVSDDTSQTSFASFAELLARSVSPKNENHSYYVAAILSNSACQCPDMAKSIIECTGPERIWDISVLENSTLQQLVHAASNPDIARSLSTEWFLETLHELETGVTVDRATRALTRQLLDRLSGVTIFEDAISNTQGDFSRAASVLKDIGSSEQSFGIWLASMVTHQDLMDKLAENPTLSVPLQHPPILFKHNAIAVSHDEFIAFLRALIGVSCVLAVYAWADSLPEPLCRERTLGILRLWQGVDGYREILNHLLLLRQMVFRLECMLDSDVPNKAGIDAEHILVDLAKEPKAMLNSELTRCVLSLRLPQSYVTEDEYDSMRTAAYIVDDGLFGAVDRLLQPIERPPSARSLRAIRVALAVADKELQDRGEREVMEEFWKEGTQSLETCLVEIIMTMNEEIGNYFAVYPPPASLVELITQLFRVADDALKLLIHLIPIYPLPGRVVRSISTSAADLFVYSDAADMLYSQGSPACIAAQEVRQTCVDAVRLMASSHEPLPGGKLVAEVVLRTLFQHGLQADDHDPTRRILQIFYLIDLLLPLPGEVSSSNPWINRVVPTMLQDLWAFARALDTENRAHFVRRLVELDRGIIGIGDWLLEQELKDLSQTLKSMEEPALRPHLRLIRQYQISLSFRFLLDLTSSSSTASAWCIKSMTTSPELAYYLMAVLQMCIEQDILSSHLSKIVLSLSTSEESIDDSLRLPLLLCLLRGAQRRGTSLSEIMSSLYLVQTLLLATSRTETVEDDIASELGGLLESLQLSTKLTQAEVAEALFGVFEWLMDTERPPVILSGMSAATLDVALKSMRDALDPAKYAVLDSIQSQFATNGQRPSHSPITLPDGIELTFKDLEDLIRAPTPAPSTPPRKVLNQDVLSLVAISPPTALIRSPAATGLTKTYLNNDFRQLRQIPSARQNTSRLPSMHVDDFENAASSPTLLQQSLPLPVPMPLGASPNIPFSATPENYQSLSPIFKLL